MRFVGPDELERLLAYPTLIAAIRAAFSGSAKAPQRHHHTIPRPGGPDATLLLMPAWQTGPDGFAGVKFATVFPANVSVGKPTVMGVYTLISGTTGEPLACIDGRMLTLWRTAATSALAADALARPEASRLLMIGAGALAPHLIAAHASVRPIREVAVWNRTPEQAAHLVASLALPGVAVHTVTDLDAALGTADVISCATLARQPLVHGARVSPGTHVDLVGAFTPDTREADDAVIRRARVFVDTREGMRESGDITQPMAAGILSEATIAGDLFTLSAAPGLQRTADDDITVFKSVGHAIEDLAAAITVWRALEAAGG